jgi:hypothetical protein
MAPTPDSLTRFQTLTRDYARYSRSAAGLGSVIGGAFGIAVSLIVTDADPSLPVRAMLVLAVPLWLLAKTWLRDHYYQRHGAAEESLDAFHTRVERVSQGALAAIAAIVLAVCALLVLFGTPKIAGLPFVNQFALVAAPLFALLFHRRINTPVEMLVAINLIVQTVIAASGSQPRSQGSILLWAVMLMIIGGYEHLRYRSIEARLRQIRSTQ